MIKTINKFSDSLSQYERKILLSYLLDCDRSGLYIKDIKTDGHIEDSFDALAERRLAGEPLQYITGWVDFMGARFIVNENVFIPRPETEVLAEEALRAMRHALCDYRRLSVLDLCTGSGCIAVSIAKNIKAAEITAIDISEEALEAARRNAALLKVPERVRFYRGDLFQALMFEKNQRFDIIVCNPPYIKSGDIRSLQREVTREPYIALDGGSDGLEFYRRLAASAHQYLKKEGVLLFEIGAGQRQDVECILHDTNMYQIKNVIKDFSGIDRVIWTGLL